MASCIAAPLFPSSPLSSQPASQWNVFDALEAPQQQQAVCSSPVEDYQGEDSATDEDEEAAIAGNSAILYEDGELSPGFDASFASSLYVLAALSTPFADIHFLRSINSNLSDQANAMDISPAVPVSKATTKRSLASMKRPTLQAAPSASNFNKSFFSQLTSNQPRSLSSTSLATDAAEPTSEATIRSSSKPLIGDVPRSFGREVNPNLGAVGKRERNQSETNLVFGKSAGNTLLKKALPSNRPGLKESRLASASVGGNVFDRNPLHS